jgi:hypothetical protein
MGMMYIDNTKDNILKELSKNIAKLHDIYGLIVKDEFLINAAYLQRLTDSVDQLGAVNEKMQRMYSMLADEEEYEKEYTCQWGLDYEKDKNDRLVPRFTASIPQHKYLTDEDVERNEDIFEKEMEAKWGYNPYEE